MAALGAMEFRNGDVLHGRYVNVCVAPVSSGYFGRRCWAGLSAMPKVSKSLHDGPLGHW